MINLERLAEIERIVGHARSLPPSDRLAYIVSSCSDVNLRRDVETLLAISPPATNYIESELWASVSIDDRVALAEGDFVAHFKILRLLDEGGLGTVYLAHDNANDRKVALKLLPPRLGAVTNDRLSARFTNRSIVALYESGQVEGRFTYFAMEYVDGIPITTYCERENLTLKDRLNLFRKLCHAIADIHDEDVAHRDLTPRNILVTTKGEVKVLDFGSARLLSSVPATLEPVDHFHTRAFASPEQLLGEPTSAKTDVYSLGVILCLLLSGRMPYLAESEEELIEAIGSRAPEPPSRVAKREVQLIENASDFSLPSCAPPPMTASKLSNRLEGDLDAIVLCCLKKSPGGRQGLSALSGDIKNYLEKWPVSVRPATLTYRSWKLLQRRWIPIGSIAIAFLFLIVSGIILFLERQEAIHQRDAARIQATRAEKVSRFLIDLFMLSDPAHRPGSVVTARELLDKAAKDLPGALKNQPETVVPLLNTLGQVYNNLNLFDESARCYRSAMHIAETKLSHENPLYADCLFFMGQLESSIGHQDEATRLTKRSLDIRRRKLPPNDPNIVGSLHQLGTIAYYQGRFALAENYFREALRLLKTQAEPDLEALALVLNSLGIDLSEQQRYREAETYLRESLRASTTLYGYEHPLVATKLNNLAILLEEQGRLAESESLKRQALDIDKKTLGNEHANVAVSMSNLGFLLYRVGDLKQSLTFFDQAAQVARKVFGPEDGSTIVIETNLAHSLRANGRIEEADALIQKVLDKARKKLGERSDAVGRALKVQGEVLCEKGDFSAAARRFEQAIDVFNEEEPRAAYGVIATRAEAGSCLVRQKRFAEAEPLLLNYLRAAKEGDKPDGTARLYILYTAWGRTDKAAAYRKIIEERFPLWARQLSAR